MVSLVLVLALGVVIAVAVVHSRARDAAGDAEPERPRRISLLTEAVAYIGAILVIAGGATAVGQRWEDVSGAGRVGILAASAALFLAAGTVVRRVAEPAIQRLVGVLWFASVAGTAAAVGVAASQVLDLSGEVVTLAVGVGTVGYAGALWLVRRRALQQVAVLVGVVLTAVGTVAVIAGGEPPTLPSALLLWAVGITWAVLGWRRYLEPMWSAIPLGVLLALYSSTIAVGEHGWYYAIAIGTAAAVMAVSVPSKDPVLLAMGTLAMFGYVTGAVVRYLGDTLGVSAALALTGLLILGLALVTARLLKAARPPTRPVPEDADDQRLHPVG